IGVNLQPNNPQGLPDPAQLGTIRWVRLVYNVSFDPVDGTYGNLDVNAAYEHYHSAIERYANAGYRVMLVFNHQTYGEGQGWNWYEITPADWLKFTNKFALMAGQIAGQYAQDHLVDAYQIWQEPDSPQSAVSVSMPAASYADVLKESTLTIRAALQEANDDAVILTAGLISGPDQAANYLDTVLTTMGDVRPDGVAFHPYGRGAQPGPLASFGTIGESIRALQAVAPDLPLWITEWGVAQPPDSVEGEAVADYAWDVIENLQTDYAGQVEAAIWFAWADSGFDAYGVVDENGTPREPLYSVLATWN
ncbi:MAG: glycoside hydrolase family protein, partial [Anaerolineae bacterium]|nr:glycoside hydrolase family protein [Anaerolineae bacterium]